ncbi:general amidase [Fusarium heterosporum]|uniref:General amidase n=1 Tax=Fusarium heterosporum TaxID=42747 RepID=A0A8H5WJX8_FUSHE|nr:general amidase [Fusarium heterosporum]
MSFTSSSLPQSGFLSKGIPNVAIEIMNPLQTNAIPAEFMLPGLPVVQVKPVPRGTDEFEAKRAAILEAFASKVPESFRLPLNIIQNPPKDVTKIPATCGILSPQELSITEEHDAVSLLASIANRKYTASEVVQAFCKRAIVAHQLTCCLTQWFMQEALDQARVLDVYMEKTGKPLGPLHGLPISIKDHIQVAGTSSSQGCFASISDDDTDADIVAILRAQGAIIYCKTNQPQSLMHLESDSHWGRVLNPFNVHLSAGGSTGGEAALIAMKGSVLGIGTDIGGSIRGPSAFCGIHGFKTTSTTLPTRGYIKGAPPPAVLNVPLSTGPMCRSLRDMNLFMECILSAKPYLNDPTVIPILWTGLNTTLNRPLKIGIISNDGFIEPQPPVKRALSWAKHLLTDSKYAGSIEAKDFQIVGAEEAWNQIRRLYWPDGGELTKGGIVSSGEPIHPLTDWIYKDGEPFGMHTALDLTHLHKTRDDFRLAFAKNWIAQDVDVIIGPSFVGPACSHDTAFYWTYTSLYNLVDYPGVVIPTPIRAESGEKYDKCYVPLSEACGQVKQLWDSGDFEGAPVNLQVVARRFHDNELFGALQVLQNVLHFT